MATYSPTIFNATTANGSQVAWTNTANSYDNRVVGSWDTSTFATLAPQGSLHQIISGTGVIEFPSTIVGTGASLYVYAVNAGLAPSDMGFDISFDGGSTYSTTVDTTLSPFGKAQIYLPSLLNHNLVNLKIRFFAGKAYTSDGEIPPVWSLDSQDIWHVYDVYVNDPAAIISSFTVTGPADLNNVLWGQPLTITGTFSNATSGIIQHRYPSIII